MAARPRLGVFKFASCDGCQLTLLDCEDEMLALAEAVDIAYFPEASRTLARGPYDIALVEGSVTTEHDAARIQQVRRSARTLVSIGACASTGGIQALREFGDIADYQRLVYARPDYISTLDRSTPIDANVKVDYTLSGCPIDRGQLLELIAALLQHRPPRLPTHSLCLDCKRKGLPCVAVSADTPCLGPVTRTGCGALCPSVGRGCYGCFGPAETANTRALAGVLRGRGTPRQDVVRLFRTFTAGSEPFRQGGAAQ